MVIGVCTLEFYLPESHSLKTKRQVINSLKGKLKNRFNISIAEIDHLDVWQRAALGVAIISNDRRHVDSELSKVLNFIDNSQYASYLMDYSLELI
jgi:uncharacterized protein YlxP (DUF503 family)